VRIWDEPGAFDRLGRDQRLDEAAVRRLWERGALITLGDGPSVAVTPAAAVPRDHWLIETPAHLDAATAPVAEVALATRPTAGLAFDPEAHLLLGLADGRALFVDRFDRRPGLDLRIAVPLLTAAEAEVAMTAAALAQWHAREGYCPACGAPTHIMAGGAARWCQTCQQELFPRTDPAVIVAVFDDADRILLAHQQVWEEGRYSVIAGFVEAGESLEQAVHREVAEEVGVAIDRVQYVASQPWPMPRSLMLGFSAHAVNVTLTPDGAEIAKARWFARDEIPEAVASGALRLPGPASIAFRLISGWLYASSQA
jgi:NAD+ diphosphatase